MKKLSDKAFFHDGKLVETELPAEVREIGNWAFAHATNLHVLHVPSCKMEVGKQAFLDCPQLRYVRVVPVRKAYEKEAGTEEVCTREAGTEEVYTKEPVDEEAWECRQVKSVLEKYLGNVFRCFPEKMRSDAVKGCLDFSLLVGEKSDMAKWLSFYDEALREYVLRPDEADYQPVFIGWFDVEDLDDQQLVHMRKERIQKQKLMVERLGNCSQLETLFSGLCEKDATVYQSFLEAQSFFSQQLTAEKQICVDRDALTLKGRDLLSQGAELLYQWLPEDELGQQVSSFEVWRQTGFLTEEYLNRLLEEEKREGMNPEVRAYLIGLRMGDGNVEDSFRAYEI